MSNKTVMTDNDPLEFIENLEDDSKKADSIKLIEFLKDVTSWEPKMWGKSIIGFGQYHYHYKSGREGDILVVGFSPREKQFSFYTPMYLENYAEILSKIGKHSHGKSCLYFKNLEAINIKVLEDLVLMSIKDLKKQEGFKIV